MRMCVSWAGMRVVVVTAEQGGMDDIEQVVACLPGEGLLQ
jgi:hypothetical protein